MQFVTAREIREGMCVAEDVRDPQGRTLIARGQKIGSHHIVRLRKFRIEAVFIDPRNGEGVERPSKSELRAQCEKVLCDACAKLTQEFANKKIVLDTKAIREASDRLVDSLMNCKNPLVTLLDVSTSSDRMMQHAVNSAVLATVIGIDLRVPEPMLRDLASAMLFHDIGLIFLPENVTNPTSLNPQHIPMLRSHPQLGIDHLVRSDAISNVSANIVLRHHEVLDGSGYPEGLTGDKLTTLIRIASVVEVYDSLTMPRFGIPAVMPDAAISYIIANTNKLFAREAVVALCHRIALYPVGSAVQLSTGEIGVVAGVLPTGPTRPVVLAQLDNKGHRFKEPIIVDLTREGGRSVVRSAPTLELLLKSREPALAPRPVDPMLASLG